MGRKRGPVLWRSAFQAHHAFCTHPRTSSPVTVALLRSAFQALNTHGNEICTASSFWTAVRNVVLWGGKGGLSCGVVPGRHIMRSVTIRALTEISGLTSRGVLQNARKMVDSIMFAIRRTRRAFCKTPLLVRLRARLPSLCSVVPSRHLILMAMKFAQRHAFELLYGTLCYGAQKGACPVA